MADPKNPPKMVANKTDRFQNIIFLIAILVSGFTVFYFRPISPGYCPKHIEFPIPLNDTLDNMYLSCFFRDEYDDAKALFLKSARLFPNVELQSFPLSSNEDLTVDVAILRGTNSDRAIIHSSGVHGVEGFAGSAVQCATLQFLSQTLDKSDKNPDHLLPGPTLIFIHGVNPYGMRHHRRVNENNVDLNRHFINSESERKKVIDRDPNIAGYLEVDDYV